MAAAPLLGALPQFCQHTTPIALKIQEKKVSLSGDDFDITDAATGARVFKVSGSISPISSKKKLLDAQGNHLATIKKEHFAFPAAWSVVDAKTDKAVIKIQSKISFRTSLKITFANLAGGGQETHLTMKGNFLDRNMQILTEDGRVAGAISRSHVNVGELMFDKQTYVLTVQPGVDAAMMTALCVVLDEKAHEGEK